MRRRLLLALVGIALASVLLVGAGVLLLAQLGARQDSRADVESQLDALADIGNSSASIENFDRLLDRLGSAFDVDQLAVVAIDPDGTVRRQERRSTRATGISLDPTELAVLESGGRVVLDLRDSVVGLQQTAGPGRGPPQLQNRTLAILVEQNVSSIGRQARIWFLLSAAAVVVASALLAAWLSSRFTRPLKRIEQATSDIASGRLDTRVVVEGDDELADLANAVNRMAGDLERSRAAEREFLMSISHDLRTPLTAIGGYAEALVDGAVDDPIRTGHIIESNAKRLNRLVDDLLDLARLSTQQFQLELRAQDIGPIVRRVLAGHQMKATDYGLMLQSTISPGATAAVDADRLGQVLGNLVDNALKFTNSRVEVTVIEVGDRIDITVADDGPGIPEEDLPFVFERLYVTKLKPARAENSSGLGLAIVRQLATAMRGTVGAERGVSGGTVLTVSLPRAVLSDSPVS